MRLRTRFITPAALFINAINPPIQPLSITPNKSKPSGRTPVGYTKQKNFKSSPISCPLNANPPLHFKFFNLIGAIEINYIQVKTILIEKTAVNSFFFLQVMMTAHELYTKSRHDNSTD